MSSQKRLQDFFGGNNAKSNKKQKKTTAATVVTNKRQASTTAKKKSPPPPTTNTQQEWNMTPCGSLLYHLPSSLPPSTKIAGFDLDGTLITVKSGKKFPTDERTDWQVGFGSSSSTVSSFKVVQQKLEALQMEEGYRIVIFSNQNGIGKGKINKDDWIYKVNALLSKLDLPEPVTVLAAIHNDSMYRKPMPGMWQFLCDTAKREEGAVPDAITSFFVGDAAGRPKSKEHKRDFAASDYKFALNVSPQMKFYTPEQFFLKSKQQQLPPIHCDRSLADMGFQPKLVWKEHYEQYKEQQKQQEQKDNNEKKNDDEEQKDDEKNDKEKESTTKKTKAKTTTTTTNTQKQIEDIKSRLLPSSLSTTQQEVVLLVGCPASGKSSLCKSIFNADTATTTTTFPKQNKNPGSRHYIRINQDTLKTSAKCLNCLKECLSKGYSVILDNTHRDEKSRRTSIQEIQKINQKIPIRCLWITTTKDEAFHLNRYRGLVGSDGDDNDGGKKEGGGRRRRVPDVVLHSYFKNLQPPDAEKEGFTSLVKVPFVPGPFPSKDKDGKLFFQFLS